MVDTQQPPSAPAEPKVEVSQLRIPSPPDQAAKALTDELGLSFTVADWLAKRGHEPGEQLSRWLRPKLAHLTSPASMADLPQAAERIAKAVRERERIVVFGDYDCDGITSTAVLTEVIGALGGEVTPLLANRFAGGYGFSDQALQRVRAADAQLLITCDCGSSDHPRLEATREAGIDAVVLDHHLVPPRPLPVVAFLNPQRPDCGYPYKGLASCGLALLLATALRKVLGADLDVRRWLDLVALGTVADVAPLDGDNRLLVTRGLHVLNAGQRVGLGALAANANNGRKLPIGAEAVAYQIAPRINAPGRLGDPMLALRLLLETDATRAWEHAAALEQLSQQRRTIQRTMTAEAISDIAAHGWAGDPALVLARQGWHPGVVGIVAGRIADQYRKPTIVIALEGETGRGSARTPSGFRLYDAIARCKDQLVGFGGHQAAAGVEIRTDRVGRFRDCWRGACGEQIQDGPPLGAAVQADVRLDPRDDLLQVLADLEQLEPCGQANPAPRLLIESVQVLSTRRLKEHLKLEVKLRGRRLSAFGPDMGPLADSLAGKQISVIARIKRDHWRGGSAPELLLEGTCADQVATASD